MRSILDYRRNEKKKKKYKKKRGLASNGPKISFPDYTNTLFC